MKRDDWPVGSHGIRPAGPDDECLYCKQKLGEQHKPDCVVRRRTVVCEFTIRMVREVVESSDQEFIEFHMNDSSWCLDNILDDLQQAKERRGEECCLMCNLSEGRFVREATEQDEEDFALYVAEMKG